MYVSIIHLPIFTYPPIVSLFMSLLRIYYELILCEFIWTWVQPGYKISH